MRKCCSKSVAYYVSLLNNHTMDVNCSIYERCLSFDCDQTFTIKCKVKNTVIEHFKLANSYLWDNVNVPEWSRWNPLDQHTRTEVSVIIEEVQKITQN